MGILYRCTAVLCLLLLVLTGLAQDVAPVPPFIQFSAILHDASGHPLSGTVGVTFLIYKDQTGGSPLWLETQNVVADAAGHYSVTLGSEHAHGIPSEIFSNGEARWLGVMPESIPELPRVLLTTVPYAMKAADAATLGGRPASAYLLASDQRQSQTLSLAATSTNVVNPNGGPVLTAADTGTPNTLAKFLTTSTLGSSLLTDTGAALGVRLTNPEQVLDILGRAQYRTEGYNTAGFFLRGVDTTPLVFVGQTGSNSADPFAIWHSGAWRLTIDKTGRVGIGTATPEYRMDVSGRMRIKAEGVNSAGFFLGPSNDSPSVFMGQSGTSRLDPFAIWHNGGWRMVVSSDGKVGIGTTSPSDRLEVAGNLRLSSNGSLTFSDGSSMNTAARPFALSAADTSVSVTPQSSGATIRVANAAITSSHLAPSSVTTSAIADGSITAVKFAAGVIPTSAVTLGANFFIADQNIRGGLFAHNYATTGTSQGVQGRTDSTSGIAIQGITSSATGSTIAVHGSNPSSGGIAVLAEATSSSGSTIGLKSTTAGAGGSAAIIGIASSQFANDPTYGVRAEAASQYGIGMLAYASSLTGSTKGLTAKVESPTGVAGDFTNFAGGTILAGYNNTNRVFRLDGTGDLWIDGVLHTGGGADFAEMVAITGLRANYAPGDVLVIAPDSDRALTLSSEPYSTAVAGVFSTRPGLLGSQHSQNAIQPNDEVPLAVIGIVPCKASAENGSIRRGDLLVTSTIPGHVMKATDRSRMLGAIVGKALSPLDSGTGTIEILVTLQ